MAVSYKKLWKLLIDRDMKKKDLAEKAKISNTSIAKMGRNGQNLRAVWPLLHLPVDMTLVFHLPNCWLVAKPALGPEQGGIL